jgi:hypothetical protein
VLRIQVRNRVGRWESIDFLVDTGSSVTTIPVLLASKHALLIPGRSVEIPVRTIAGRIMQRRRVGTVVARIPGLQPYQFTWPCHFIEAPQSPANAALGLAGVLDDLRLSFDGTYRDEAPYGTLTLEPISAQPRRR